jgi:hypothetical protein
MAAKKTTKSLKKAKNLDSIRTLSGPDNIQKKHVAN